MKQAIASFLLLIASFSCHADDFGLRINSLLPNDNSQVVAFPPSINGVDGKQIQLIYSHDFSRNFYIEGAVGYMSTSDIFEFNSASFEFGPGVKEQWGPFTMKLMVGASYVPGNKFDPITWKGYNPINFGIHLTFGLTDPKTGVFFGLDRVHYSDGFAENNPALNYSGFIITIPIGKR